MTTNTNPTHNQRGCAKTIGILASMATVISTCIAAVALIPDYVGMVNALPAVATPQDTEQPVVWEPTPILVASLIPSAPVGSTASCEEAYYSDAYLGSSLLVSIYEADPELQQFVQYVKDYILVWLQLQELSFMHSDAQCLTEIMTGQPLQAMRGLIEDIRSEGMVLRPVYNLERSYLADVRILSVDAIQFDLCLYVSEEFTDALGNYVSSNPEELLEITGTMESSSESTPFYITNLQDSYGSGYCQ
jgi:hypothetical protein